MSDVDEPSESEPQGIQFDITDPTLPDYYINIGVASVSNNDLSLCFGRQLVDWNGKLKATRGEVRVSMTHNVFMLIMADLIPHYNTLIELYGDEMPNLVDLERRHPERFKALRRPNG